MKRAITLLLFLLIVSSASAGNDGDRLTRGQYIDMWAEEAVSQMVTYKIPASITLAQGILESGDGNSELARKANNHFGIKCHSDWDGKKVYHDDDARGECFRKYGDARESFEDHSVFLTKNRYASLFELDITDYKGWARGLKRCGYATNPKYANLLIDLIEAHQLTQYDDLGLEMIEGAVASTKGSRRDRDQSKPARGNWDQNEGFEDVHLSNRRTVALSDNRIKYVIAKEGDTFQRIADELDMMDWQIRKYNDFARQERPQAGEIIYLQPKRNKAKSAWHTLAEGESMRDVSQRYGIKLKKLYRLNNLVPGEPVAVGTRLSMRKRIKSE